MSRQRTCGAMLRTGAALAGCWGLLSVAAGSAGDLASAAQVPQAAQAPPQAVAADPKVVLIEALGREALTAPFFFEVRQDRGRLFLEGRVGSRLVHDAAIQTAFGLGIQVVDNLIIDTAAPRRVATVTTAVPASPLTGFPSASASTLYPYPAPLFGPPIDPFWGYEAPLITYPPWWQALSAQRTREVIGDALAAGVPVAQAVAPAAELEVPQGNVAMSLDPMGYARLTGKVPSAEARAGIVAKVTQMQGVVGVIDRLVVDQAAGGPVAGVSPEAPAAAIPPPPAPGRIDGGPAGNPAVDPTAPPPPRPVPFDQQVKPAAVQPTQAGMRPPGLASASAPALAEQVRTAIESQPALVGSGVGVTAAGDTVTLSGEVPGAYEAMRAFLAAQATPGVGRVIDVMRFTPPQAGRVNPLIERGEASEVAHYLEAQIARQCGRGLSDARVEVNGSTLRVAGQVGTEAERQRVEAILRSMPILRGFTQQVQLAVR